MKDARGTVLRFTADRATVGFVGFVLAVQLLIWHFATPLVAALAALPLTFLCIISATVNHNHQHVNVFRAPLLNRIFELPLALQTGIGPYSWVLHHNLGHHLNYLHQYPGERIDESRWTRPNGAQMGRLEYAFTLFATHPIDIYRVGRKHPQIYRRYLLMRLPLYALAAVLFWLSPLNTLIVFGVVPMLVLLHTCQSTYDHHAGLRSEDPALASYNCLNPLYNLLSQNLGYHTAHHMRPGLHWSLLPSYHEELREQIPEKLIRYSFW